MEDRVLSRSMEDYLEAILQIVSEKEAVRAKDIARRLGVTRPSVTGALRTLARAGLIRHEPYDAITLTDGGRKAAEDVVRRHEALKDFFVLVLGVREDEAARTACAMEHAVSDEVSGRLTAFVDYARHDPEAAGKWRRKGGGR
jgi:DtxR family Mn-dependent transcriptional regulator